MDAVWVLGPIAAAMAGAVAALVRWSTEARTLVAAAVVAFLLGMMVAMFVATWIYFSAPGPGSLVIGLWVAAALMSVSLFPVVLLLWREARDHLSRGADYRPRPLGSPAVFALTVTALVFGAELLMGRSFALAAGASPRTGPALALAAGAVAGPWFLFPMALEMALTVVWLRARFPPVLGVLLGCQAAMMLFGPPALAGSLWVATSGVASTAAMTVAVVALARAAYRDRDWTPPVRRYASAVVLIGAGVGIALALWAVGYGVSAFAIATSAQMALFFWAVVVPERFSGAAGRPSLADGGRSTGAPT